MEQVLQIANGPVLWLFATLVIGVVVVQSLLYLRMTLDFSDRYAILTPEERRIVYKTAAINSVGPAIAIFFVAVSLMAMVGGPVTLMRVGVIGSAVFEFLAADQGAKALGAKLGADSYTLQALTASVWVMTLGGMGWLLSAFLLTKGLDRAQNKMSVSNPGLIRAVGTATPVAIFGLLGVNAVIDKTWLSNFKFELDDMAAVVVAALCMVILHMMGKHRAWLREWSVGFALIAGLVAGSVASHLLA